MRSIIIAIVCLSVFAVSLFACPRPQNPYLGDSGYCKNPDCRCILNMQDAHGRTLLHKAAAYGRVEMVRWLLSLGADWTVMADSNKLPFEYAYFIRKIMKDYYLRIMYVKMIYTEDKPDSEWVFTSDLRIDLSKKQLRYTHVIFAWQYEQIMEMLFDQGAGKGAYKELFEGYFDRCGCGCSE